MLNNYLSYLEYVNDKLSSFFDRQKPYIHCKKGCTLCCKNAQFPYSQAEINYLMIGLWQLDLEKQQQIAANIENIQKQKREFRGDVFKYDCPFLLNDECSVYNFRGGICRAFGLMYTAKNGKIKVPFCCFQGYNYSNVVEDGESVVSQEKFEKLGVKEEPLAFNTSYDFLTGEMFEKSFNITFGEKRALIDWFSDNTVQQGAQSQS